MVTYGHLWSLMVTYGHRLWSQFYVTTKSMVTCVVTEIVVAKKITQSFKITKLCKLFWFALKSSNDELKKITSFNFPFWVSISDLSFVWKSWDWKFVDSNSILIDCCFRSSSPFDIFSVLFSFSFLFWVKFGGFSWKGSKNLIPFASLIRPLFDERLVKLLKSENWVGVLIHPSWLKSWTCFWLHVNLHQHFKHADLAFFCLLSFLNLIYIQLNLVNLAVKV